MVTEFLSGSDEPRRITAEDAAYAWKTGGFEGVRVLQAPDPGGNLTTGYVSPLRAEDKHSDVHPRDATADTADTGNIGLRIDLSRIGGN
ncbi:lysozyme family protein [Sinorhizobium prairiense]|uniref:hypothetical protein n=1 Tax=unclassified Sinorhizobium TaxID=2613772 RepID=UPI0023D808DE|nr:MULTISPECIES: hypothetical protein [unclassified Sinorhizobium]WEJ08474.1 hypothetical protein N0Q90_01940 [Sinorhizobium sp. M103]WEJ14023.1 hypothetical protein N0Q91_00775 [Sinorhizobium sp. K101]WEJ35622.1 hypothetical protein N0R80_00770 [Sinorhizobium sp. C101]